jgi:putative hydrolase of the HAD superfamily
VGARAIRIRQGEYASAPDEPRAEVVVESFPAAVAVALRLLDGAAAPVGPRSSG